MFVFHHCRFVFSCIRHTVTIGMFIRDVRQLSKSKTRTDVVVNINFKKSMYKLSLSCKGL
jgi:hypothetical protein